MKSRLRHSIGGEPLQPEDIAEAVLWCLERPPRVNIQEMVVLPAARAGVGQMYLQREES